MFHVEQFELAAQILTGKLLVLPPLAAASDVILGIVNRHSFGWARGEL